MRSVKRGDAVLKLPDDKGVTKYILTTDDLLLSYLLNIEYMN
jgi:hypothetical protein